MTNAISIENVSISYRVNIDSKKSLKNLVMRASKGERVRTRVIEAVKNLNLEVPHGMALGIIGANGAGKSTLMRAIAGILPPTEGRITVDGNISTLLALGIGFNQSLSGRDNIILGGLAAGLTKDQITAKVDEIAEFADLPAGFLDLPVRTYSAGMYSRIAFSVSVAMTPDILLIDEALATGDAAFKEKSLNRMKDLMGEARTIVIVSHAMGTISELCQKVAWLHQGKLIAFGPAKDICDQYLEFLSVGKVPVALEDF